MRRRRDWVAGWVLALLAAAIADETQAQVLELGSGGDVLVRDCPAVYTRDGVTPITVPVPPKAGRPADIRAGLETAARRWGVHPALLLQVARQESALNPRARSPRGAVGVMQLSAAAARDVGVDRWDMQQNIDGGAAYLRRMIDRFHGNLTLALAAYNAGPQAVLKHRGVPPFPETRTYVSRVLTAFSATIPGDPSQ